MPFRRIDGTPVRGKSTISLGIQGFSPFSPHRMVSGSSLQTNGKASNGKAMNGKAMNGKAMNGKAMNGKATNGKATNGKATNGKATNGVTPCKKKRKVVILKKQIIESPHNVYSKAYRELLIHQNIVRSHQTCFVKLLDWVKSSEEDGKYITYVLEKADITLKDFLKTKRYSELEIQCIVFQIVFALSEAQRLCKFMHNDFHLENILLKKLPLGQHCKFQTLSGDIFHSPIEYIVKITDFGLSSIRLKDGTEIYNKKFASFSSFDPLADISKLKSELQSFSICLPTLKKQFKSLLKQMNSEEPCKLLSHPFFASLKEYQPKEGSESIFVKLMETPVKTPMQTDSPKTPINCAKENRILLSNQKKKRKRNRMNRE